MIDVTILVNGVPRRVPADLSLAAALAAMIQGPNRLSPVSDAQALAVRQAWVLDRMRELGWATAEEVASDVDGALDELIRLAQEAYRSKRSTQYSYKTALVSHAAARGIKGIKGLKK